MDNQTYTSIFYADDDIDDLDFFREVTTAINEPVSLFKEGQKLLTTLHNPPPNASIIFLDLNMPVKSGFDVLQEIKAIPSMDNIPIIILTTSTNPSDIELCKSMGANLYIRKPTSITALKKAVNYVLSIDWTNYVPTDKEFVYKQ